MGALFRLMILTACTSATAWAAEPVTYSCVFQIEVASVGQPLQATEGQRTLTLIPERRQAFFFEERLWYDTIQSEDGTGFKRIDDIEGDCRGVLAPSGDWFLQCRSYFTTDLETHTETGLCQASSNLRPTPSLD